MNSTHSAENKKNEDFDNYVEGALVVYSQFKTPSKKESEEFYDFIKNKWVYTFCDEKNCNKKGEKVALQYVEINNIEKKDNKKSDK